MHFRVVWNSNKIDFNFFELSSVFSKNFAKLFFCCCCSLCANFVFCNKIMLEGEKHLCTETDLNPWPLWAKEIETSVNAILINLFWATASSKRTVASGSTSFWATIRVLMAVDQIFNNWWDLIYANYFQVVIIFYWEFVNRLHPHYIAGTELSSAKYQLQIHNDNVFRGWVPFTYKAGFFSSWTLRSKSNCQKFFTNAVIRTQGSWMGSMFYASKVNVGEQPASTREKRNKRLEEDLPSQMIRSWKVKVEGSNPSSNQGFSALLFRNLRSRLLVSPSSG